MESELYFEVLERSMLKPLRKTGSSLYLKKPFSYFTLFHCIFLGVGHFLLDEIRLRA